MNFFIKKKKNFELLSMFKQEDLFEIFKICMTLEITSLRKKSKTPRVSILNLRKERLGEN